MKKLLSIIIFLAFLCFLTFTGQTTVVAESAFSIHQVKENANIYTETSLESSPVDQVVKGQYVIASPVDQDWSYINMPQQKGYVETANLLLLSSEKFVVKSKNGTSLYMYPSPSAQKLSQLNENIIVHVYGTAPGGWSFVQYGHEMGYVATNTLKNPVVTKKRVSASNGAVLYLTASPNGEVVGNLTHHTIVNQYTIIAGWAYVEAGEQKGYMKASELTNLVVLDNKIYNKGMAVKNGEKKRIALTFDDGPDAKVTPQILAVLKKYDVKATFFMVGKNVSRNPAVVEQIYEAGHEIGNHTWNHPKLTGVSKVNVIQEVDRTSNAIYAAIGQYPTVFRPPYGATNDQVRSVIALPSILWSVDTLDWKHRNADKILTNVKSSVKDGSIILMHDIHQSTANGLENVILYLQQQGYEMVTVSDILQ